jgi:hypothetical protein
MVGVGGAAFEYTPVDDELPLAERHADVVHRSAAHRDEPDEQLVEHFVGGDRLHQTLPLGDRRKLRGLTEDLKCRRENRAYPEDVLGLQLDLDLD